MAKNAEPCSLPQIILCKEPIQRFMVTDREDGLGVSGVPVCFPKRRSGHSPRTHVLPGPAGAFRQKWLRKPFSEVFSSPTFED